MPVSLLLALITTVTTPPKIVGVRSDMLGATQVLTVQADTSLSELRVDRRDSSLTLSVAGVAAPELKTPAAAGAIQEIALERDGSAVSLRLQLAPGVRYQVERNDSSVTLVFEQPGSVSAGSGVPGVDNLYPLLFPHGVETEAATDEPIVPAGPDEEAEGVRFGPMTLQPAISATYINAEAVFLETPVPTPVDYFEVVPSLTALTPLSNGRLTARYEPRLRTGADFDIVNDTTHEAEAILETPITPVADFDARYRFVRGTLEAREVDPGGEFFFGLGRFTHHGVTGDLEVETGPRTAIAVGGYYDNVDIDDPSRTAFFSHERFGGNAGLRYELRPTVRATLGYAYDQVPAPPDRPIAESRAHSAFLTVDGEFGPLTTGSITASYRSQTNPQGLPGAENFDGFTFRGSIQREFSRRSSIYLGGARGTFPSAFQANPYYVGLLAEARLRLPLPWEMAFTGSVVGQWNDYPLDVMTLGFPREDRVLGWSVGLARPINSWAFLRADYRKDNRRSNIDDFDIDTDALTIQLGIGFFGATPRR